MWVKICGIRDVETALTVAALGPDAIGLNFFQRSPRCVEIATAAEIVRRLPPAVEAVGVFVNHPVDEVRSIATACGLHAVQLHGDEPPEAIAQLTPLKVIRAFRIGEAGCDEMAAHLERCRLSGHSPALCLVDARVEGTFGGTGRQPPWETLAKEPRRSGWPPLVLAGGLTPENVSEGIRAVWPWGVDVAGGVESSPGVKDLGQVERFLAAAKS